MKKELSRLRVAEADPDFYVDLLRLARKGMLVGAVLGIIAVVLFIGIYTLFGKLPTWHYQYQQYTMVLWDKLLIIGLCTVLLITARRVRLNSARLLTAFIIAAIVLASGVDDILNGAEVDLVPGYTAFAYLIAVIAVPFRPRQAAALGVALAGLIFLLISFFPSAAGIPSLEQDVGDYIYMLMLTVLATGLSWLLYVSRYEQFRARREAERLREHVEELAQVKNRFFTNISHEFRTPLTLLLGPIQDALEGRHGPLEPVLKQRLDMMNTQAHRLRRLIDQLLDLSKIDAGKLPLRAWRYDFVSYVRHQVSLFQSLADHKHIDLQVDVPGTPLFALFDPEKMEEVITNLLSNAFKFTPEGGTIRIRVTSENRDGRTFAVVSVRDSGRGIPPEALSVVFDRFYSTREVPEGQASTGIGLALVKEIVERHGGHVEAASEPGFGAEITLWLPLGSDHLSSEDLAASAPESTGLATLSESRIEYILHQETAPVTGVDLQVDGDAPLIIIVEDDPHVLAYVHDLLVPAYRVMKARDGNQALELIRENRPELVISDVLMPGLDGFELCREIKTDDVTAVIPVILLTALSEEARLEGLKSGADAYLAKPFSSTELLVLVENLIEVRRVLRQRVRVPDWMQAKAPEIPSHDAAFLDRVQQVVIEHLEHSNFGVDWLADEVGLSPRQLQRRLQALTRLSAGGFIKTMRLERAAQLLRESDLQVNEVAHAVGYEDTGYFSRLFRQAYGVPPSEFTKVTH